MDEKPVIEPSGEKEKNSGGPGVPYKGQDPFTDDLFAYADQGHGRDRWSVSWSDLMMTMFIFFVVMFIYQVGNRNLKFGPGPSEKTISDTGSGGIVETNIHRYPTDIYDQTRQAVKEEFVDETVSVDLVADRAVRIALAGDLFFDVGQADIKPESKWRLRQIAKILNENNFVINVVGHTDSVPNHSDMFPTNWELSSARACRVARYLIEEEGIPEERFFVSAHSWHQPIVPNSTEHNRSLNRRVEIILMKEMPYQMPTQGTATRK
ncbi:MAG: flagellar motor protein MotB [Pseudomonadota bacterium]